jgi:ligand-binding sensor domain-containing protein
MNMNNYFKTVPLVILFAISSILRLEGQDNIALGDWRVHMPFSTIYLVEETPDRMYGASDKGFFYFQQSDLETVRASKSMGYAEVDLAAIKYHEGLNVLVLAYNSTNLDLVKGNKIINIPDIKRKTILGLKRINHIYFKDNLAILSCSFGIVVVDLEKEEIKDSYLNIGDFGAQIAINEVAIYNDSIYAAYENGIIRAKFSNTVNLSDFNNWEEFSSVSSEHIIDFNGKLVAEQDSQIMQYSNGSWSFLKDSDKRDVVNMDISHGKLVVADKKRVLVEDDQGTQAEFPVNGIHHAIVDKNDELWFGISIYGLIRRLTNGTEFSYSPSGPPDYKSLDMFARGDEVWVAGGSIGQNNGPTYSFSRYYIYKDNSWMPATQDTLVTSLYDWTYITKNPRNNRIFIGTYSRGFVEFDGTTPIKVYDHTNTPLESWTKPSISQVIAPEVAFDSKGRLWTTNFGLDSGLLMRDLNGNWHKYKLPTGYLALRITVDDYDQIWMSSTEEGSKHNNGILVFNPENGAFKPIKNSPGSGNLPSSNVNCMFKDKSGEIWVGTSEGLAVFYRPRNIFSNVFDAQKIIIEQNGVAGYLLGSEVIYCIEDDGSGRKWIGTNAGAWLISENGTDIVEHFTAENSPLLSNTVRAITVHEQTGEVFFGTEQGIVSYRGDATKPNKLHSNVKIFPNPVKHGYDGTVAISGLPDNALVKITDINGGIIYETTSNGGTATWNCRTFDGTRPKSGVYLVFSINSDGEDSFMSKIIFIN